MLLSTIGTQNPLSSSNSTANHSYATTYNSLLFSSPTFLKPHPSPSNSKSPLLTLATTYTFYSSSSSSSSLDNPHTLRYVTHSLSDEESGEKELASSASAVVSAIRKTSTSPAEFLQRIEDPKSKLVLPSPDFQRLCAQQLDLFRRIVHPEAILSVYVRPAGSYVMDRLELRRVTVYPGANTQGIVILVGNFSVPTGLRAAEATLSKRQVEFLPEHRAVVFPMVKHPFVVGFLVAEFPNLELEASPENMQGEGRDLIHLPSPEEAYASSLGSGMNNWGIQAVDEYDDLQRMYNFTVEQRLNAINIAHTLAMAYVMDQKAIILQQSSWQNNIRMSNLVEQIRGPLSSIRTLSKMLSLHTKRSEISFDIIEDIVVQGERMRDTLQELQDAVFLTKANIVRYNEETIKKFHDSAYAQPNSLRSQLPDNFPKDTSSELHSSGESLSPNPELKDLEMPMPPLALAPIQQHGIRPCSVSEVLSDLVEAVRPLAHKQQRVVELCKHTQSFEVAVEEPALRQALSNLIEGALLRTQVGGKVEILFSRAPAGGALVVVDDDGPDMHYMTQMHSLTPFGAELLSENMVEDNMTWNFVAGLTVAREILESYGCVIRVISPRIADAALGAGGTRIELWLPSFAAMSDLNGHTTEA